MRSVEDVLNRIKHDPLILARPDYLKHFLIAYIDRVFGDQEIAFEEFFSNVDYKEVPLHRISYIRYCDEIIWCRSLKYDAVFGSSNANATLQTWLDRTEELVEQQHQRWAYMLAEEQRQAKMEEARLEQLNQSIEEQKEIIQQKQARSDEEDEEDNEEDDNGDAPMRETKQGFTQETPVPSQSSLLLPPAIPSSAPSTAPSTSMLTSASSSASTSSASFSLDSFESLPARTSSARAHARNSRTERPNHRSTNRNVTDAEQVAAVSAVPSANLNASPQSIPPATSTAAPSASTSAGSVESTPFREDDANITFTVIMFDPLLGQLLHSARIRISLVHADWSFLMKRIASKVKVKNSKDIRRLYFRKDKSTTKSAPASSTSSSSSSSYVKLTEDNFSNLLKNDSIVILMAEIDPKQHPVAVYDLPRKGGTEETEKDFEHLSKISDESIEEHSSSTQVRPTVPISLSRSQSQSQSQSHLRPNYFISLRITNPDILAKLDEIQAAMIQSDERNKHILVPKGTFHITLSLLCIYSEQQLTTAIEAFQQLEGKIKAILSTSEGTDSSSPSSSSPVSFPLVGLSTFSDRVLYADLPDSTGRTKLTRIAELLSETFEEAGVGCEQNKRKETKKGKAASNKKKSKYATTTAEPTATSEEQLETSADSNPTSTYTFTPHLTLAKLSRVGGKLKKDKRQKRQKLKGKSQPKQQIPNTGIIELGEELNFESHQHEDEGSDEDSLPQANFFSSLHRTESTETVESTDSATMVHTVTTATDIDMQPSSTSEDVTLSSATAELAIVKPSSLPPLQSIDRASYSQFQTCEFGSQLIDRIDLCQMSGAKQQDGYYQCKAIMYLQPVPTEDDDMSE